MKLLTVVLMVTLTANSFAQTYGIKAGLNLSKMIVSTDQASASVISKSLTGFQVGLTAEYPITKIFSFETGLLLSSEGMKMDESTTYQGSTYEISDKIIPLYLNIPLTAKASFDVGGAMIYGAFGPYIGIGLSGKAKIESTSGGSTETSSDNIKWGSGSDNDLKRLDFGLSIGAGVEINKIQLGLTFSPGLANISASTDNGAKIKNQVLGISIGYKFGKK